MNGTQRAQFGVPGLRRRLERGVNERLGRGLRARGRLIAGMARAATTALIRRALGRASGGAEAAGVLRLTRAFSSVPRLSLP